MIHITNQMQLIVSPFYNLWWLLSKVKQWWEEFHLLGTRMTAEKIPVNSLFICPTPYQSHIPVFTSICSPFLITTCHYLFGEGLSAILLHHGPSICDCQIDSIADGQTAQLVEQLTGARFKSSSGRSINTCVFLPSCYISIHFDYLT